jgi:hypothetical protein
VLILMIFVIPPLGRPHHHYEGIKCINNQKNVGLAFRIFATDNNDLFPMELSVTNGGTRELHARGAPFHTLRALSNELSTPKIVLCPKDSAKVEAANWTNFTDKNLSYFLNLDATETAPTNWLCGDRNLLRNNRPISPGLHRVAAGTSFGFDKTIHMESGNITRADGSVSIFTSQRLLQETNHPTFKIAVP